jgi:hypothetical protein
MQISCRSRTYDQEIKRQIAIGTRARVKKSASSQCARILRRCGLESLDCRTADLSTTTLSSVNPLVFRVFNVSSSVVPTHFACVGAVAPFRKSCRSSSRSLSHRRFTAIERACHYTEQCRGVDRFDEVQINSSFLSTAWF